MFENKAKIDYNLNEFAHKNRDLLIIVADPKTDKILVAYKDLHSYGKIHSVEGKKISVVRDVLKHSKFNSGIDQFLAAIIETMQLPIKYGSQFLQFIDGSLFNIAKVLADKVDSGPGKPQEKISLEVNIKK